MNSNAADNHRGDGSLSRSSIIGIETQLIAKTILAKMKPMQA
jgi:hypothetical protein